MTYRILDSIFEMPVCDTCTPSRANLPDKSSCETLGRNLSRALRARSPMTFLNFDWRVFFNAPTSMGKTPLKYSYDEYLIGPMPPFEANNLRDPAGARSPGWFSAKAESVFVPEYGEEEPPWLSGSPPLIPTMVNEHSISSAMPRKKLFERNVTNFLLPARGEEAIPNGDLAGCGEGPGMISPSI